MAKNDNYRRAKAWLFGSGVTATGVIEIIDDSHFLEEESDEVKYKVIAIAVLTFLVVVCVTLYIPNADEDTIFYLRLNGILKRYLLAKTSQ